MAFFRYDMLNFLERNFYVIMINKSIVPKIDKEIGRGLHCYSLTSKVSKINAFNDKELGE